jgi:hypothetical protein
MATEENLSVDGAGTKKPATRRRPMAAGRVLRPQLTSVERERPFKRPLTLRRFIEAVGWDHLDTPLEVTVRTWNGVNQETVHPHNIECGAVRSERHLVLIVDLHKHLLTKKSYRQQ